MIRTASLLFFSLAIERHKFFFQLLCPIFDPCSHEIFQHISLCTHDFIVMLIQFAKLKAQSLFVLLIRSVVVASSFPHESKTIAACSDVEVNTFLSIRKYRNGFAQERLRLVEISQLPVRARKNAHVCSNIYMARSKLIPSCS